MKLIRLVFLFAILGSSCKLMPRKDENDPKKSNVSSMTSGFKPLDWVHSTNIYEVNLRQYTDEGTFNAFAAALPRLKDMGVHTLWFMPVQPVGIKNRKGSLGSYYSISDYTAINPEFGTLADFRSLVKKAQGMGFKVIIDWVANHSAWDNIWTIAHPDFFTRDHNGNFLPPVPDWADVIDLNYDNKEMRAAMIAAMKYWVDETGIDGFRCDMAHMVPLDFWKQARLELDAIKPLLWLGETEETSYHQAFDLTYTWEFLHQMEKYWRKETGLSGLDSVLHKYDTTFPPNAMRMYFTSNHDENSHSGTEYTRMGKAARAFAVFCATWNGIPLVYSGQEIPNNKSLQFFEKDPILWPSKNELHDFYKILLNLHSTHPALRAGDAHVTTYRIRTTHDTHLFAYLRKNGEKEVLVILNLTDENVPAFEILDKDALDIYREVFSGVSVNLNKSPGEAGIKAWEYYVFEK